MSDSTAEGSSGPRVKIQRPRVFRRTASGLMDCNHVLTKVFHKTEFKGKQKEIVEAAVLGADVFVVAPTGMGKSLCFQIPALADKHGITIVVSPLLALMKNQVANLKESGIPAVAFTSETSASERAEIAKDLASGHPLNRLLYITPEKLMSAEFQSLLHKVHAQRELSRLVVDEAHCISEWGHDFRAEYRKLGSFRDRFHDVPIMALTASATPSVQEDIVSNLRMSGDHLLKVVHPFNRENLFYEVRYLPDLPSPEAQYNTIYSYINGLTERRGEPSCGIVYARTRKTCDELAVHLRGKGIHARPYHRGISSHRLDTTLREWSDGNRCDVVVATVCFGMGIDKPDVRYVIHFDLPKSFEGYYQETGRGGRDGLPAKCVIYYSREDAVRVKKLVNQSYTAREYRNQQYGGPSPSQRAPHSVQRLIDFCENANTCRHVAICRYFGENVDTSDAAIATTYCQKMCDVCKNPEKTRRSKAALSSEEFVMTQVPRLEKEAARDDGSEDEDGYPSTKGYARIGSFGLESDRTAFRTLPPSFRPLGISALQARPQILPNLPKSNILGNTPRSSKGFWASDGPANGVMVKSSSLADSPSTLVDGHIDHFADDAMASPPGLLKRESDITNEPATASTKRARVGNALSELDTMPIRRGSAQRPFRPPFKTPPAAEVIEIKDSEDEDEKIAVKKPSHKKPPSSVSSTSNSRNVASTTSSPDRRPIQTSDVTSSPVKFDTETGDVDGALSKKIPVNIRERTLETFRRVLHKNLMVGFQAEVFWGKLKALDIPQEDRSGIVLDCVKQLEFLIMCYSVTTEGYRERSDARLQALRRFVNETDAIDSWMTTNQRTGKGKANTVCNEEVEEVMRILCKLTNDWKAKRKGKSRACPPQNTRRGWAEPEASSPSETGNTDIQEDGDASVMIIDGDDDDGRERSQEWDFGKTVLSSDWEI